MEERTLVLIKPDGVQRGLVGEILTRFEKVGLKIVGMKMIKPTGEFSEMHYSDVKERHGEKVLQGLKDYFGMGPVIAFVLEGDNSIEQVRKMVGKTEPRQSEPGTIRGDFCRMTYKRADSPENDIKSVYNVIHASANTEDADREIGLWFSDSELWEYDLAHQHFF